jgi:prepilin-type N-terminal cleavage/methylation domain-containing protein/prepilin-type processing-associated H-X9-DG protein
MRRRDVQQTVRLLRPGFTLIELTVTIAVAGMLAAIILPAVQSAREGSRRAACRNNLRQIGVALANFESAHGRLPPGRDGAQRRQHSWATAILGHLGQSPLYAAYDFDRAWHDPANHAAVTTNVPVFRCPSAVEDWPGKTDYGGNYGSTLTGLEPGFGRGAGWEAGTLLAVRTQDVTEGRSHAIRTAEITDGTSHTFLVLEDADRALEENGLWANGHNCIAVDRAINSGETNEINSRHPGGAHALLADGSVRLLNESMNPELLGATATRAEGEAAVP